MPLAEFRDWLGTFTEDVPQLEGQKWAQALRSQAPSGERHDPSTPDTAFMRAEWSAKSFYLGLSLFISGDADMPKPIFVLSLLVAYGHAAEEHKTIAVSEWSKPVESHDRFLQARWLLLEGRSRAYAGAGTEVLLYVELQNANGAWGEPLRVFFDPAHGLQFDVHDSDGKAVPPSPTAG